MGQLVLVLVLALALDNEDMSNEVTIQTRTSQHDWRKQANNLSQDKRWCRKARQ